MPAARNHKQAIKILQQIACGSAFFNQTGLLCPLNSALNRILVEVPKYIVYIRTQIKRMQKVRRRGCEANPIFPLAEMRVDWTNLQILPLLTLQGSLQVTNQEAYVFG
jgi:hypothetical protein